MKQDTEESPVIREEPFVYLRPAENPDQGVLAEICTIDKTGDLTVWPVSAQGVVNMCLVGMTLIQRYGVKNEG